MSTESVMLSSSAIHFFCLQSFLALRSFTMSQLSTSVGQSIGASATASFLPMNVQGWFPLGLTGLISCSPEDTESLLQNHSSKALVFWHLAFCMLPTWLSGKESACQYRNHRYDPWIAKIPWRRKWQPTPVFLPGKFHGQRSLVGYSPWGNKESDMTEHSTHTAFFMVQFSHPYMTTGKTIALTIWTFVSKVMPLFFNMMSRFVMAFLPRSIFLWLQSPSAVILEPPKKICYCFHFFPFYLPWSDGTRCHDLCFLNVEFEASFFTLLFHLIKRLFSASSLFAIRVLLSA